MIKGPVENLSYTIEVAGPRKEVTMTKRVLVGLALISMFLLGHNTNIYNGTNKGITIGSCGYEFVGVPGFFC
jgi:hypothetical protein